MRSLINTQEDRTRSASPLPQGKNCSIITTQNKDVGTVSNDKRSRKIIHPQVRLILCLLSVTVGHFVWITHWKHFVNQKKDKESFLSIKKSLSFFNICFHRFLFFSVTIFHSQFWLCLLLINKSTSFMRPDRNSYASQSRLITCFVVPVIQDSQC